MKIGTENLLSTYNVMSAGEAAVLSRDNGVKDRGKNYDEIVFSSNSRQMEEKIFIGKVAEALKAEVRDVSGQDAKIERLREAVKNGTYVPDSRETAAKMLLLGGGR